MDSLTDSPGQNGGEDTTSRAPRPPVSSSRGPSPPEAPAEPLCRIRWTSGRCATAGSPADTPEPNEEEVTTRRAPGTPSASRRPKPNSRRQATRRLQAPGDKNGDGAHDGDLSQADGHRLPPAPVLSPGGDHVPLGGALHLGRRARSPTCHTGTRRWKHAQGNLGSKNIGVLVGAQR